MSEIYHQNNQYIWETISMNCLRDSRDLTGTLQSNPLYQNICWEIQNVRRRIKFSAVLSDRARRAFTL